MNCFWPELQKCVFWLTETNFWCGILKALFFWFTAHRLACDVSDKWNRFDATGWNNKTAQNPAECWFNGSLEVNWIYPDVKPAGFKKLWVSHLYSLSSLHHRHGVVAPVVLRHTVLTDTAGIGAAEKLQGPLVALAGPPLDVPERVHQPVVVKLGVLQVRPEVGFTVGHQAGEAGLEGPAGALDTGVTHHIVGAQRFLLHLHLFFHLLLCTIFLLSVFWLILGLLGVFRLLQVLLDLGLLGCCGVRALLLFALHRSLCFILLRALSRLRLAGALHTPGAPFGFVPETGATNRVRTGSRRVSIQHTWAESTQLLCGGGGSFLCYCVCHVFSLSVSPGLLPLLCCVKGAGWATFLSSWITMHSLKSHTYVEDVSECAEFQSIWYPPLQHSSRQASKEWYTHNPCPPLLWRKKETTGWSPHHRLLTEV